MAGTRLFEGGHVMGAREVAQIGWNAMKQGRSSVTAGRINATVAFLTRFAPSQMAAGIARRLQERR
jgi:short-subunit dehydrogenase